MSEKIDPLLVPQPRDFPAIRRFLKFYKIAAWITGVLLLLLVVEMVLKYFFHLEIEMFGPGGFIDLTLEGSVTGLNLSRWILIVHGWFYVIYLVASYLVWQRMRWELGWLLMMAGGGVVPFLSFITEMQMANRARKQLAGYARYWQEQAKESAELDEIEASLTPAERAELEAEVAAEAELRASEKDQ